eukprot:5848376-Pyramimonas_sp.AAC.1
MSGGMVLHTYGGRSPVGLGPGAVDVRHQAEAEVVILPAPPPEQVAEALDRPEECGVHQENTPAVSTRSIVDVHRAVQRCSRRLLQASTPWLGAGRGSRGDLSIKFRRP